MYHFYAYLMQAHKLNASIASDARSLLLVRGRGGKEIELMKIILLPHLIVLFIIIWVTGRIYDILL